MVSNSAMTHTSCGQLGAAHQGQAPRLSPLVGLHLVRSPVNLFRKPSALSPSMEKIADGKRPTSLHRHRRSSVLSPGGACGAAIRVQRSLVENETGQNLND